MSFGRPTGPPATRRQLEELLVLLQVAGHRDFRDARGPMGFTQRQGNGNFTRDEAERFIATLTDYGEWNGEQSNPELPVSHEDAAFGQTSTEHAATQEASSRPARPHSAYPKVASPVTAAQRKQASQIRALRDIPSELLAAELQDRGWAVISP